MMKKSDWAQIAAGLKTMYRSEKFLADEESVVLWFSLLQDLDAKDVSNAVLKYVQTQHFPPTVSDIRGLVAEKSAAEIPDWESGWHEVKHAIHRYGGNRQQEALDGMTEITRHAVESLGWQSICQSDVDHEMSVRSAFKEIYLRWQERTIKNMGVSEKLRICHQKYTLNDDSRPNEALPMVEQRSEYTENDIRFLIDSTFGERNE